jgi:hypothetical protein
MTPFSFKEANELVLQRISQCGDEHTILGFLPLSLDEEDQLIQTAKKALNDYNIFGSLRTHPACTAYFLAIATSRCTLEGRNFWPRLMEFTGLDLQQNATRQKLADAFNRACRSLDLLTGSLEDASWGYVAPFYFQAGILHRWTDHIASGLKGVITQTQAPDLESPDSIENFITRLCDNYHLNGEENLKHTLRSAVGPLLIRSLVRAYHHSNWDSLPAHLRSPIRQTFNEVGRGAFIHVPYLRYNRAFDEIEVVLPPQNNQVASFNTKWEVNEHRYDAQHESILPSSAFSESEITIQLTGQNTKGADRTFDLPVGLNEARPFKLFALSNGREKRLPDTNSIDVIPDDYLVVMQKEVSVGDDEELAEITGNYKILEISLRPGEEPLALTKSDNEWRITAMLRHGFYTNQDEANLIHLDDGGELFYGDAFGIVAYFPRPAGDDTVILSVSCMDYDLLVREEIPAESQIGAKSIIQYKENIDSSFTRLREQLKPGIHKIRLSLTQSNKSISKEFWLWKGLRAVDELNGFDCEDLPENLDYNISKGIVREDGKIRFQLNDLSPYTLLKLTSPDQSLKIPRPGVQASMSEPGHTPEAISKNALIVVHKGDKRTIHLESGGFESWCISSGNHQITTLDTKRTKHSLALAGLAAEVGHSGIITAKDQHDRIHKLISFSLPLTSSPPRIVTDNVNLLDEWSFKVATEGLHSLGYTITNLSDQPDLNFAPIREFISQSEASYASQPISIDDDRISICATHQTPREGAGSDHSRIKVCITFDIDKLEDRLYAIDIYRRTDESGEWLPLQCDERQKNGDYNYSNLRFFAWGDKRFSDTANFWQKLRRATVTEHSSDFIESIQSTSIRDLDKALHVITELLAFKYPSAVWMTNAHRIENFAKHLSAHRFNIYDPSANLWWRYAAMELAEHANQTHTPVVRNFLFSTEPNILRVPREHLMSYAVEEPSLTDICMMLPGKIKRHGSKIDYIMSMGSQINSNVLFAFGNFMAVHSKQANDLKDFSLSGFLESGGASTPLSDTIIEIAKDRHSGALFPLFSAEHLLTCIRRLNTRCRKIQEAVNSEDQLPLQRAAQSIEKAHQQIQFLSPTIAKEIGWDDYESHVWTPPLLANDIAVKVSHLTWMVAAIVRLAANQKLSPNQFESYLQNLLCRNEASENKVQGRLNIILSLAPELFSCYMALFELSINSKK